MIGIINNVSYKGRAYSREDLIRLRTESLKNIGINIKLLEFPYTSNSQITNKRESLTANILGHKRTYKHTQKFWSRHYGKHDASIGTAEVLHHSNLEIKIKFSCLYQILK